MTLTAAEPKLLVCDVLDGLAQIESESIDCIVTSPPYWGLRDYGMDNQLGMEPTDRKSTRLNSSH